MMDKTLTFILIAVIGVVLFAGMSILTLWIGRKIKAHALYASNGLIPSKTWFGYPEHNTEITLTKSTQLNIWFFNLVAIICFGFSLFLAVAIPIWIVISYTQVL